MQQQVEMVGHQAVGVHFDLEALVDLGESLPDLDPVVVIEEDGGSVGPTIHHVVPAAVGVGAWWSRHSLIMNEGCYIWGLTPDVRPLM